MSSPAEPLPPQTRGLCFESGGWGDGRSESGLWLNIVKLQLGQMSSPQQTNPSNLKAAA
jgi:hypothetical protein